MFLSNVIGYEGHYSCNEKGDVFSVKNGKIKKLKDRIDKDGYNRVMLYKSGEKTKNEFRHRIIASVFLENKNNYPQVNHINGIKTDNRVENLEWVNARENTSHRSKRKNKTSLYTGVYWSRACEKWAAKITINQQAIYLGVFESEEKAKEAYLKELNNRNQKNKYS